MSETHNPSGDSPVATSEEDESQEHRSSRETRGSLLSRIALFYRQVIGELGKVVWPGRRQLLTYTVVVIVFVLIVMAYVTGLDTVFGQLVFKLFG